MKIDMFLTKAHFLTTMYNVFMRSICTICEQSHNYKRPVISVAT